MLKVRQRERNCQDRSAELLSALSVLLSTKPACYCTEGGSLETFYTRDLAEKKSARPVYRM